MEGLSVICAGLGTIEEDDDGNRISYTKDKYCLDNLKDLLRFLRRDDPQSREVFKQVCKWNIVGKDLIPIIEHCQDDRNLVLNSVKVLVFLTMPIEATSSDIPQQIEYLWGLKSSITSSDIIPVVMSLLETPLENLECEAFTEDDWKLVQLVITLFRNILAIQDISTQQKAGGYATQFLSLRDRFLELLFKENVMDLILVLSQHVGGSYRYIRQDNLLLLEILHYIFMGQEPELIAKAYAKGSKVDGDAEASLNALKSIMEEEVEKRRLARLRNMSCFSQFGTFTRLTLDGSKTVYSGNPCFASRNALLKAHKDHRGRSQRMVWDHGRLSTTKSNILQLLHGFLNQLLSGGYNVLMQSVREDIEKEHHKIQSSDVVIFFHVAEFVISFQYHKVSIAEPNDGAETSETYINNDADHTLFKGNICGPIAALMNESMFLLVILKWRNAFDGLKETNDYKFLSAAGSLLKIMIRMLELVLKQSLEDSREPQTARVLLYKLFYDQTDQGMTQFLLNLMKSFNTHKQPRSDLANLVETVHVVLRLMENLQDRGTLRVSKKVRKKKKKMSERTDEVDKTVKDHGINENDIGASGMSLSEDGMSVNPNANDKEQIQIDGSESFDLEMENSGTNVEGKENKKSDDAEDHIMDDLSDDEQLAMTNEVDFNVSTLVSSLVSNTIIQNLCWLLKFYKSNSISTNHHIISILRRICDDLELSPMLYQLSFLATFYDILVEQKSRPCKDYENIVVFLTNLVRRMLRKMKSYPLLFVEVLFWKTRKECHYINCQSMLNDLSNLKKESGKLGSLSEDGDIGSSKGKGWVRRNIADALGDDEADIVLSHSDDDQKEEDLNEAWIQKASKTNRSFSEVKKSVTSFSNDEIDGKDDSDNENIPGDKRTKISVHHNDQNEKIIDLFEKYKDNQYCCQLIAEALQVDGEVSVSPDEVSRKLRKLRLTAPRKKRVLRAVGSEKLGEEVRVLESEITSPNMNSLEDKSSLGVRQPLRKRVSAFSEDQEQKIRALFEQFKDQRRCSYMIANALDADGTFSAAQITRKLKQLGLRNSQPKKKVGSGNSLNSRDEDVNDLTRDSDDETLLSLKKRKRTEQNRSDMKEWLNEEMGVKPSEDESGDELLSSLFEKTRKVTANNEDEILNIASNEPIPADNDSEYRDANDFEERDLYEQSIEMETVETENEAKADHLDDELVDFVDDEPPLSSPKTSVPSRRLKMVVDLDDED